MSRCAMAVRVSGREKDWSFPFVGDTQNLEMWRADGLDVVEVVNTIPEPGVRVGLLRPWVFLQDLWNVLRGRAK